METIVIILIIRW